MPTVMLVTSAGRYKRLCAGLRKAKVRLPRVKTSPATGSHKRGALAVVGDLYEVMRVARLTGGRFYTLEA